MKFTLFFLVIMLCMNNVYATNSGMPGGYNDVSTTNSDVQQAATFAVNIINKGNLIKIITAQTQVVAGTNYKLQLELLDANGKQHFYNVVVFKPLPVTQQPMQVTHSEEVFLER